MLKSCKIWGPWETTMIWWMNIYCKPHRYRLRQHPTWKKQRSRSTLLRRGWRVAEESWQQNRSDGRPGAEAPFIENRNRVIWWGPRGIIEGHSTSSFLGLERAYWFEQIDLRVFFFYLTYVELVTSVKTRNEFVRERRRRSANECCMTSIRKRSRRATRNKKGRERKARASNSKLYDRESVRYRYANVNFMCRL